MRKYGLLLPLVFASDMAFADAGSAVSLPAQLDMAEIRADLARAFPKFSNEIARLDALSKFARELELFRINSLEQLNFQILGICTKVNKYELHINRQFDEGDIALNEKSQIDSAILEERQRCGVAFAAESQYWRAYYDFFNLYSDNVEQNKLDVASCYSNDACRLRQ